jgi:hypothetical protein
MGITFPFLTDIGSDKKIFADALNRHCMQFLRSGNPVYLKGANHGASFVAKQEWRIKEQHLIDNPFSQGSGSETTATFDEH